jgi:hypothetical protein
MKKTLVAGWFSFEDMGASAGDLIARDLACDWLKHAGHIYDIAVVPPFTGGVDWRTVNPQDYSHVVFVCGPFGNGKPITDFLNYFSNCHLVGLNLTMLESLESWNPFELLWERDSNVISRPDITFLSTRPHVPVVGLVLIDTQPEYKRRNSLHNANEALRRLISLRKVAIVPIDTRLDVNKTGLRTAAEVESIIAHMDLVLTTRLHGIVLSLKNGVPVLAIDSVIGGGKVKRQADTIGWPCIFPVEEITDEKLQKAFEYCLTAEARRLAKECGDSARRKVTEIRDQFIASLS